MKISTDKGMGSDNYLFFNARMIFDNIPAFELIVGFITEFNVLSEEKTFCMFGRL
ncbi:hypothetical protein V1T75_09590 [Tenacibaculum sp. FZY0031]|uniref:hypothetical protein n=1 Tax=unclassified Tenacibaculum TaxID=2635139 RepID=UPI002EB72799|nr:hypothetical protein [Tenacibaculum sp. FZY0031]